MYKRPDNYEVAVERGGRKQRLFFVFILTLLLCWGFCTLASASVYLCRDRSGTYNFTNVRNSADCKIYNLKGYRKSYGSYKPWNGGSDRSIYDRDIRRIGKRYNVDPPLIKAIIHAESDFNPQAVSKKGAQGLMQLMPATARELRVYNPFNPKENIDGGTRYFRKMMDDFNGDLILSLAAYNAGPGLVRRTGGVPRIQETRRYVNKVLKQYKIYKSKL